MTAVLIVQMCLAFGSQSLCTTIDSVPFTSAEDCATASMLVTKHSGRGITASCVAVGRKA